MTTSFPQHLLRRVSSRKALDIPCTSHYLHLLRCIAALREPEPLRNNISYPHPTDINILKRIRCSPLPGVKYVRHPSSLRRTKHAVTFFPVYNPLYQSPRRPKNGSIRQMASFIKLRPDQDLPTGMPKRDAIPINPLPTQHMPNPRALQGSSRSNRHGDRDRHRAMRLPYRECSHHQIHILALDHLAREQFV